MTLASGPLDADLVLIGNEPDASSRRAGQPFHGQAGALLDRALQAAGVRRTDCYLGYLQGLNGQLSRLEAPRSGRRVVVPLGEAPLQALLGLSEIRKWRGSLLPPASEASGDILNEYWTRLYLTGLPFNGRSDVAWMPCYDPADVLRQMPWHYWLLNDLRRAARYTQGKDFPRRARRWIFDSPLELARLVDDVIIGREGMVSIDTEMQPLVTSLVTEEEVHVFTWEGDGGAYREPLARLMASPRVLKVAHNMQHDWRQFEKVYELPVAMPWFDTIAGAHALEPGGTSHDDEHGVSGGEQQVGKALSPHIATRFTGWPFHKWLVQQDDYAYCGMDSVVGYDAYWAQMEEIAERRPELSSVLAQDMRLFEVLFRASSTGLLVDEAERQRVATELTTRVEEAEALLGRVVEPTIQEALAKGRFQKPALFQRQRQCECCGGGSTKREACWACAGYDRLPTLAMLPQDDVARLKAEGLRAGEIRERLLAPCAACSGEGSYLERLPLNLNSSDQVADLFYRGLRVPARRYQGKETTRFEQMERLLEPGGYLEPGVDGSRQLAREALEAYVAIAKARAELGTVKRLEPGADGRLRTTFDLWYTPTHRVASREGLLDVGTNLQNIPYIGRRFIVAEPGFFFIYPDYAQIEGRCQAVLSGDPRLLDIYHSGQDSHMEVVRLLREKAGVSITRDQAKRVSYAAFYDIEASHLGDILGISEWEARKVLAAFFTVFQGAKRYKQRVEDELRRSRSVTSPTGWRRRWLGYVLETKGRRKGQVKKKVRKEALATGPQCMAAHVMAEGLLRVWDEARELLQPLAHVHDSCLLHCRQEDAAIGIQQAEELMTVECWGMPFPVTAVCGPDWLTASLDDEKKQGEQAKWKRSTLLSA